MKKITTLVISAMLLTTAIVSVAWSSEMDEKVDIKNARELGAAIVDYVSTAHMCRNVLGTSQYRIAKASAINIFERVSGDRNSAVLKMDGLEQKLKENKVDERMDANFREMKTPRAENIRICQELVSEELDKVTVLKAKLQLL